MPRLCKIHAERERLIEQAAEDLRKAQQINPLNTDHTANLARLYSACGLRLHRTRQSSSSAPAFRTIILPGQSMLSPNNARLWDEWAVLDLNVLNQPERA